MKITLSVIFAAVLALSACSRKTPHEDVFTVETINRITPVKNQGHSSLCWVYAMLATIESDRIMMGDSVNLSPAYVARHVIAERAEHRYLAQGGGPVTADGVAPMLLDALERYGVMPYDSYRSECNYDVLCRRLTAITDQAVNLRTGLERLRGALDYALDTAVNPMPHRMWMYGAEYTPQEFARSLCQPDEYLPMTSYTHMPFYEDIVLDVPANRTGCRFYNVPVDTLVSRVENGLRSGLSVCWEGDTTNPGFSFKDGTARLAGGQKGVTQDMRQRALERFSVTDDHCMEIIGLARDAGGNRYFICKNSWGTDNPYGGLMYMSLGYFRLNTVAVVMKCRR